MQSQPTAADGEDFGKFFQHHLFDRLGLNATAKQPDYARHHASEGMENLNAYSILRLLRSIPRPATCR